MNECYFGEEEFQNNDLLKCKRKSKSKSKEKRPIQEFIVVKYLEGIRPVDKTCCSSCHRNHNRDPILINEKKNYLKLIEKIILE